MSLLVSIGLLAGCQTTQPLFAPSGIKASLSEQSGLASNVETLAASTISVSGVEQVSFGRTDTVAVINAAEAIELSGPTSAMPTQEEPGPNLETQLAVPSSDDTSPSGMSLAELESLALVNSPAIQELAATTQKAAGYRTQVGLRPNPVLGYQGMQLADEGTDQHVAYVSQTFVTADKLALNRQVQDRAVRAQLLRFEARKYQVLTDVRTRFYDALAAQQRIELIQSFQQVADSGLEIAELRKAAEEGTQLDVIQARVQKNEIDLTLQQAEIALAAAWRELAAIIGVDELEVTDLLGSLQTEEVMLNWDVVVSETLAISPEYRAAQARVSQARANVSRQAVQCVPNIDVQLGTGFDNATDSGMINLQVGAPVPLFNKNQGNLAAANAELARACKEVERVEKSIRARLASVSQSYESAVVAVKKYEQAIIPSAEEGLALAEATYQAGEAAFLQVLLARRTFYEAKLNLVSAQASLAKAKAQIDGYVLTGGLDPVIDNSGDDSLRGLTLSQQ